MKVMKFCLQDYADNESRAAMTSRIPRLRRLQVHRLQRRVHSLPYCRGLLLTGFLRRRTVSEGDAVLPWTPAQDRLERSSTRISAPMDSRGSSMDWSASEDSSMDYDE